jgi:hypothetical protein
MAIIKVKTGGITADAVTDALIADDVVGTEHLTANEVDTAALKADAVTGAELADNAVNSEHYTDGSIDTAHIADNQITLAKLAGGTDGNIISYDASGDPVAIATGNDGQVLTSAGAGAPPAFEAIPGGGAWNLLQTVTASSSATVQLTGMDSTYKNYAVIYTSMIPATDDTNLNLRVITSGGVQSGGSDYLYAGFIYRSNGSTSESVSAGAAQIAAGGGNFGSGTGESGRGTIYISDPSNTSVYTVINGMFAQVDNGGVMGRSETAGAYKAVTAVTGVEFLFGSGAVASGVFKLYGIS